ncbi:lysophospholipid acyltransferase family protein [Anaerocolumna sp. AGMB13025]|uniref:lysophospholipid acyltransferase family protein n=1 Tax=Anaerocolumna sp. AGMB13025 TaxID=3039116 RepID=UPI00241F1241|nr:lysophospholipid acyltransferase family protein [Anaerocolumna sp. AGMB13025]WFR59485.1 lysophospholipid acyltransferase family protein [Anaerocolumna sp. AGMB13025]
MDSLIFSGEEAANYLDVFLHKLTDSGVDINNKVDFKKAIFKLFNIELYNMPDLDKEDYILASNHVSDFDAVILGLLHDNIKILSKKEWVDNDKLMSFVLNFYDLLGVDRNSSGDMTKALIILSKYLKNITSPKHVLIFPQGTISDINNNSIDRIYNGIFSLSYLTQTKILPIFLEQPSMTNKTRIVFGRELLINNKEDHRSEWIEELKMLQKTLDPPPRTPQLSYKHLNNNKIGEPFF